MQGQCNASKPMPATKMSRLRSGMHEDPPYKIPYKARFTPTIWAKIDSLQLPILQLT